MLSGARRGGLPWGVAGKIRAMISKPSPLSSSFPPYKPPSTRYLLQSFRPCPHRLPGRLSSLGPFLAMDQKGGEAKSPEETKEPVSKIQKLDRNGASEVSTPLLRVKRLSEFAVLPTRASPLSAGYDLSSAKQITIPGRGKALVPTDLSIAIPERTYARIAPRSGLALKHSIDVGAGVIDADYRGPVGVILFNHSDADFDVKVGDRIAQLIIQKILTPDVAEVEDLDSTERGVGGFGSTGL